MDIKRSESKTNSSLNSSFEYANEYFAVDVTEKQPKKKFFKDKKKTKETSDKRCEETNLVPE